MSDPAFRPGMTDRRAPALFTLGEGSRGFARDRRFSGAGVDPGIAPLEDPVARAFADGYARGASEAREAALAEVAARDAARERIELGLRRIPPALERELRDRLRETVLALCDAAVAPAAIDPEALARRVETAAAMLSRAADERVIRLHPEDLALVEGSLPEDWAFEPDPSLERGAIRVEGSQGGVEDGPAQWRAAIEDALRGC